MPFCKSVSILSKMDRPRKKLEEAVNKELRNSGSLTFQPSPVMATDTVSSKLLVDPKSHKVLFAEGDMDFVDFLFSILSLPVGTVIKLLTEEGMVGCLGNLYDSIETLADNNQHQTANKDTILKPILSSSASNALLLLPNIHSSSTANLHRCSANCSIYFITNDPKTPCPACTNVTSQTTTVVNSVGKASLSNEGGYVKGVPYMIMDDLVVQPMSTISSITLLNEFNVKDVGVLEEKVIDVGVDPLKP